MGGQCRSFDMSWDAQDTSTAGMSHDGVGGLEADTVVSSVWKCACLTWVGSEIHRHLSGGSMQVHSCGGLEKAGSSLERGGADEEVESETRGSRYVDKSPSQDT